MQRVKSFVFNSFSLQDSTELSSKNLTSELTSFHYSEKTGHGFKEIQSNNTIISGVYLKRIPTFIQDYDQDKQELSKKQVNIFLSINFEVDFEFNLLSVQGGLSQMNALKSAFRNVLSVKYECSPIKLDATVINQKMVEKSIKLLVSQMTIKAFNYKNGLIGRFSGSIINQKVAQELIQDYKSEIVKLTFNIILNNSKELVLQVHPNGTIKFLSDDDQYLGFLNFIKNIIIS